MNLVCAVCRESWNVSDIPQNRRIKGGTAPPYECPVCASKRLKRLKRLNEDNRGETERK